MGSEGAEPDALVPKMLSKNPFQKLWLESKRTTPRGVYLNADIGPHNVPKDAWLLLEGKRVVDDCCCAVLCRALLCCTHTSVP